MSNLGKIASASFSSFIVIGIFKECKRKRQRLHELQINTKQDFQAIISITKAAYKLLECSCALARPASGALGRA